MRRSLLGTAMLGFSAICLAAATAQAGVALTRPDLLEVDDTFYDANQTDDVNGFAFLFMDGSQVTGSAGISVDTGSNSAGYLGEIDDFDKASKSEKSAEFSNKMFTYMSAFTYFFDSDDSEVEEVSLENCALDISAKDDDKDGDVDSAKWKLGCKKGALEDIGLDTEAQDRLAELFKAVKPKGAKATTLSYSGKGPVD